MNISIVTTIVDYTLRHSIAKKRIRIIEHRCVIMPNLQQFLKQLRTVEIPRLIKQSVSNLNIVCGNESADFDSVACAISYAYFEHAKSAQNVYVPIINIPKEDLMMRRDIMFTLNKLDISQDLLFFREDLMEYNKQFSTINAVIVDHNELPKPTKQLITDVIGIIDHHADKQLYPNANPRIITVTGSCSSLVTNFWSKNLESNKYHEALNDCAPLLISAGLLDTANMKYKVENPDVEAFKHYGDLNIPLFTQFDSAFRELRSAKDNIDGLTVKQLIRKDYKEYDLIPKSLESKKLNFGVTSIVEPVEELFKRFNSKDNFFNSCYKYREEYDLDCLVLLTSWNDPKEGRFRRELIIIPKDGLYDTVENLCNNAPKLELKVLDKESQKFVVYEQFDLSSSRKRIMPYLQDVYSTI